MIDIERWGTNDDKKKTKQNKTKRHTWNRRQANEE